ncbi:bifunctional hydroxymethylpyrimidine kinase/phosphomethylpyrimidine kinase [Limosilactobacillus fermentum]
MPLPSGLTWGVVCRHPDWLRWSTALIDKLSVIIDHFSLPVTVIDPVMGDRGSLYPGLDEDYVVAVRQLCQKATVITPNWTELCLLAGYDPTSECTQELLDTMVEQLRQEGISARVIVTGDEAGDFINCLPGGKGRSV